jgi:hypothetical protein
VRAIVFLLILTACANEPVSNLAPEPFYPSCETVRHAAREDAPDSLWRDLKNQVIVMEQIRATLPKDEQPQFGECKL